MGCAESSKGIKGRTEKILVKGALDVVALACSSLQIPKIKKSQHLVNGWSHARYECEKSV